MTSNITNRETIRDAVAALLSSALVGSGLSVQSVYNYQVAQFGTESPVVVVTSSGSIRSKIAQVTRTNSSVYIDIHIFVTYTATSWTEAQSEDRLDLIEKSVLDCIFDNQVNLTTWDWITQDGRSKIDEVEIGGEFYRHEVIPLKVDLHNG